jgi:hypothetical protein
MARAPASSFAPRLAALARSGTAAKSAAASVHDGPPVADSAAVGVCELCAAPLAATHRHLLELDDERLRCVCTPCALLFDRREAALGRYRLVPDRVRRVKDFELDEQSWSDLAIPVGLAYLVWSGRHDRVRAFYPGALGAVESRLGLDAWTRITSENPILRALEPDVEALLIRRLPSVEDYWLVSVETCFELVAILRTRWRGLTGGERVWSEIDQFFDRLAGRSREVDREGNGIHGRKEGNDDHRDETRPGDEGAHQGSSAGRTSRREADDAVAHAGDP